MRSHQREVVSWLGSIGATRIRIEPARGKGHPRLRFHYRDKDHDYPMGSSPGDRNAGCRRIGDLKKLLGLRQLVAA